MRRFKIDYIVPEHGLRSSISSNEYTNLNPFIEETVAELREVCVKLPSLDYSVSWGDLSSNTLATTWIYFHLKSDYWVPSNSFDIVFNKRFQWWNGPCSSKNPSHYDLKSTMIHEVLHGIGYMSTIDSNKTALPSNFDLLLHDGSGSNVVKDGHYTGSLGDPVYIDHIRMYNPIQYNRGSSFMHEHSDGLLMSHSQTRCTQHLDKNSITILNHLGYGCSSNNIITTREQHNGSDTMLLYVGFFVVIFVGIVICICNNKSKLRKPRKLEEQPLLLISAPVPAKSAGQ